MIRKITTKTGETKYEARLRMSGRGSKYQSRRFDRKIDAERFVDQLKRQSQESRDNPFATTKLQDRHFKEEAELCLADAKLSHSPGHLKCAEGFFAEFLPAYGDLTMEKFTPEFFSRYQQTEKRKSLENSTIDKKCTMIQAVLNFAVQQRRIPFNPTLKLRKLSRGQPEMLLWNQEEAKNFLSYANEYYPPESEDRWIYVSYLVALNTGMRAGETGRPINHDSFTDRRFEMDLKRWGGRRIRFHDMRHTATTLMLASGVDYKTVQEVCGHASFKTTMNYVHLLPGHVERVLERFGLAPEKPSNVLPLERKEVATNAS